MTSTYSAHEAIRMELTVERWDVIFHYSAVTTSALRRKHIEIVVATIRFAVALMEAIVTELLTALGAEEVLGVPGLIQGRNAFLDKRKKFFFD